VIWVGGRQQRTEVLIAVAVLALLAALLVPSGLEMAHAYDHNGLSACLGQNVSPSCANAVESFTSRFEQLANLTGWLTLLPGLIGVLLAAPFILQLESGTYRLDWTQSITRGRWIAHKLALAVAGAVLISLADVALITWWRAPLVHLRGRMDNGVFDSEGIVVFGYTLFALGLALAVGVVWRRAVAALVVAFLGYFAARLFVDSWLRQRLTPPATLTWPAQQNEPAALHRAWIIDMHPSDRLGRAVHLALGPCPRGVAGLKRCFGPDGAGYTHAIFEPAGRFWSMQAVEFGLFAGVALALMALAAWWTHARTA
jgi:hypothetical protein